PDALGHGCAVDAGAQPILAPATFWLRKPTRYELFRNDEASARLQNRLQGMAVQEFAAGGCRYIPGVFQYSAGVAALPGFEIIRVRLMTPVSLAEGFTRIGQYILDAGRPLTAFCACELRSPAPFSDAGFLAFNKIYVGTLERWGLFEGTTNPVARSNV